MKGNKGRKAVMSVMSPDMRAFYDGLSAEEKEAYDKEVADKIVLITKELEELIKDVV